MGLNLKTDLKQLPHRENYIFQANVKAHPPLGARESVERGVEVVITENHVNRTAPSGWMERLVLLIVFSSTPGFDAALRRALYLGSEVAMKSVRESQQL